MVESSKYVKPWRELVATECRQHFRSFPTDAPVVVHLEFVFARPASHLKVDGSLRKNKPLAHVYRPDLDKLVRAILDAITGVVIVDDSQVVEIRAEKYWSQEDGEGVRIITQETTQ